MPAGIKLLLRFHFFAPLFYLYYFYVPKLYNVYFCYNVGVLRILKKRESKTENEKYLIKLYALHLTMLKRSIMQEREFKYLATLASGNVLTS